MTIYVSHLAANESTVSATACGEPWQGWQAPLDYQSSTLPPNDQPRPHVDRIRFCGACAQRVRRAEAP